jgi:hypothetical protein
MLLTNKQLYVRWRAKLNVVRDVFQCIHVRWISCDILAQYSTPMQAEKVIHYRKMIICMSIRPA